MTVKEYTKEFYKLNIRSGQREKDEEKFYRYINGLRYEIQDEISMMSVRTVEDAYQISLKVEEKLSRKQSQRNRGRIPSKSKGVPHDKTQKSKGETEKPHNHSERGGSSQGRQGGGRSSSREKKKQRRRSKVLCQWKDMTHVLGMSREK
jgi:hypothetical protein